MKYLLISLISGLWLAGGQRKLAWARDILVPVLLGLGISLNGHYWLALICCATYQAVRLGYGAYDPENDPKPSLLAKLTHDRRGWYIRAIYGAIVALAGSLPLFLGHSLPLWGFLAYLVGLPLICFAVVRLRLNVLFTDLLIGAGVGSILLLI